MRLRTHTYVVPLTALLLGLTACGSHSGGASAPAGGATSASLVHAGDLTVCSDVPYPPFEDFDSSTPSGFKGFDVDVVSYVASDLGLKLVVNDSDFDALQSGLALNAGQCDLAASAMTITPTRAAKLGFSDGYYNSEQSLLVAAASGIHGLDDLVDKKVGVQKGSTGEMYAEQNAHGADIVSFPSDAQMYAAIKAGQVDALLQDLPVNLNHENDPQQGGVFTIAQTYDTHEKYGFAMKKDNTVLISEVDDALRKMRSTGEYRKVYDSYFKAK
jgi:polar amino acid transport system substrate-binding protein